MCHNPLRLFVSFTEQCTHKTITENTLKNFQRGFQTYESFFPDSELLFIYKGCVTCQKCFLSITTLLFKQKSLFFVLQSLVSHSITLFSIFFILTAANFYKIHCPKIMILFFPKLTLDTQKMNLKSVNKTVNVSSLFLPLVIQYEKKSLV